MRVELNAGSVPYRVLGLDVHLDRCGVGREYLELVVEAMRLASVTPDQVSRAVLDVDDHAAEVDLTILRFSELGVELRVQRVHVVRAA